MGRRKAPAVESSEEPCLLPGTTVALPPDLVPLLVPIGEVFEDPANPRRTKDLPALVAMIRRFGYVDPIVVNAAGMVEAGHQRLYACRELGATHIPRVRADHDGLTGLAFNIAHNRASERVAEWDQDALAPLLAKLRDEDALEVVGWDGADLAALLAGLEAEDEPGETSDEPSDDAPDDAPGDAASGKGSLAARFGVPPFTVLDTRQGYWLERKRAWFERGINSGEGRKDLLLMRGMNGPNDIVGQALEKMPSGTSIFDPVLAELLVRWFSPPGGRVLDPFAGGSVRGIVSASLGRHYIGIDLRPEQVEANRAQIAGMNALDGSAQWICGDSAVALADVSASQDMILSCPPYFDLEVYSDRPDDLSAMGYDAFCAAYRQIIALSVGRLAPDSFACWVIGDVRDEKGFYRGLVTETIGAFEAAGARLYNEAVLINSVGTWALRAGKIFAAGRKLGKLHQNVLVFYKGDPRAIRDRLGPCDVGDHEAKEQG